MANLLDQASIVLTPTAYDNGKVLCAKPSEPPYGDFDFSRNSAATRVNAQGLVENVQILSSNLVQNGDFSEEGAEEVSNGSFSQEGVQLITNGSFDTDSNWTKVNATISGGTGNLDSTSGTSLLFQSALVVGKTYKAILDVTNYNGLGTCALINSNGDIQFEITSNGNKEFYFTHGGSNTNLTFRATSGGVFSIDNVSVREVGQDWTLGTGWSIGEDKAVATNSASGQKLRQAGQLTASKTYKLVYEITELTLGGFLPIVGAVQGTAVYSIGTYTEYITTTNDDFYIRTLGTTSGSITNISVKEVGMDWTLETGWSIGDDVATCDGTNGVAIQQPLATVNTKLKKITFTVSNYVSGQLRVYSGAGADVLYTVTANGTYTYYDYLIFNKIFFYSASLFNGSITNISVIEISSDTNLPRINYENFSYQDALGSELILNGDFSNGFTNWSTYGNTSVSNGVATIGASANSGIYQSILSQNKSYKVTINVTAYNGVGQAQIANDTGFVLYSINGVGEQSFIFKHTIPQLNLIIRGLSNALFSIDNVSVKEYSGQIPIPNSGCGSWLWEPQTSQLVTYSELFSNAAWGKNSVTLESGYLAPDGTNTAFKVTGNNSFMNDLNVTGLVATSTRSIYARTVSGTGTAQLLTHNSNTNNIFTITEQWQRFDVSTANTSFPQYFYAADFRGVGTLSEIILWGANATNDQDYATSYIPSNGSQVTRNQDVCNNGGSLATINSTEGVLYAEIAALADDGTTRIISLSDGTTANRVNLFFDTTNTLRAFITGVPSIATAAVITDNNKVALKFKSGDISVWLNGTEVATSTSAISLSGLSNLSFNQVGSSNFFGKTKALAVWKEALSDQELADLTYPTPTDPTFSLDFDTIAEQFTFARGSEATYVDAQGLIQSTNELGSELVTGGDFSNPSDWNLSGQNLSISNGKGISTGSNFGAQFKQTILTINKTYKLVFDIVDYTSGAIGLTANYYGVQQTFNSVGTHTAYFTSLNQTELRLYSENFIGSIDNVSVKEVISATNTPRLDYSTGAEAFLLEPQSTNLVTDSQNYNSTYWGGQKGIMSDGGVGLFYLSPTSNVIKYEVTQTQFNQMYYRLPSAVTIGNTYTQQGYVKCDDAPYIHFQISTLTGNPFIVWDNVNNVVVSSDPSINSYSITSLNDGWVKAEITYTATVASIYASLKTYFSTSSTVNWAGVTVGTIAYQTFVQVEELPFASSYIPSNGSQTTRNQETCINATPEINSEEGVLYAEIAALSNDGTSRRITLLESLNNKVSLILSSTSNSIQGLVVSGGSVQFNQTFSISNTLDFNKIAVKYKTNDFAIWVNGVEVATDTSGNTPIGLSELSFADGDNTSNKFFGNTKDVQVYTKALSDAELISLTSL